MKEGASAVAGTGAGKARIINGFPITTNESYPTTSFGSSPGVRICSGHSLEFSDWRAIPAPQRWSTFGVVRPGYSAIEPILAPCSLGDRHHVAHILDRDILCGVLAQNGKYIIVEVMGYV